MPYTMNGVGTWYYGKKNHFKHDDFCPYCNRYVTLSSYDTREYFVVLFVPVIPLGKKRIMDSCPACTRHRQMSLKKYLAAKQDAYQKADQKFEQNPDDPQAAVELLQVFAAYQDVEMFEEAVPAILGHFPANAPLLTTAGVIYYQHGQMDKARQYMEQSLAVQDDVEIRHLLGFVYTRLADPDTAARYFHYILDSQNSDKAPALLALADAFQAQGRHGEALKWLEHLVGLRPEMEKDKAFRKTLKLSQKHQSSGKPILNKQLSSAAGAKIPISGARAWTIAAAVCAALFILYSGISFYMGLCADVFLVNGLERPYEAVVNGTGYVLQPSGCRKITLPEGKLKLSVTQAELRIEPAELEIGSPFWKRPFMDRVYVINPDQVAFIEWAKVFYHENANLAREPQWQLYHGKELHVFDGVHCPFKELPERIEGSNAGSGSEFRVQIQMLDKSRIAPEAAPKVVEQFFGFEAKIAYLKKMLYYQPQNRNYLFALSELADTETFLETIRPGLEFIPVRVEWHRLYQTALDRLKPDYDLAAEYKARLEKWPQDAGLMYLYGRALHDRTAGTPWFERSIKAPKPAPYGYYAIGYDAMSVADYPTALEYFEKARQLEPDNPVFNVTCFEMLLAQNHLDKACAFCQGQILVHPMDYQWLQEYTYVLNMQGKAALAGQVYREWCDRNKENFTEQDFQNLKKMNTIQAAYIEKDSSRLQKAIGEPNDVSDQVILALNGKAAISNDLMAKADSFPPMWLLLFYISESRVGNQSNAELFLTQACRHLSNSGYDERCLAAWFESGANVDPEKACGIILEQGLKATALTALGIRYPEHRQRFFNLAMQLNYKKIFPYQFIDSVCRDPGGGPVPVTPAAGSSI